MLLQGESDVDHTLLNSESTRIRIKPLVQWNSNSICFVRIRRLSNKWHPEWALL